MPSLLLFLISLPLGISSYCIIPLNYSVDLINKITSYVSSIPGAHTGESLGLMPDWGIFLITFGFLWLCIWQSKWRYWGILCIVIGLISILTISKPDFIFDETGSTYAFRNSQNKLVPSQYQKNKFLTKIWTGNAQYQPLEETIVCNKDKCTYKNKIEFTSGKVTYNNNDIPLQSGGYINMRKGVTYHNPEKNRLWNK
jgi:competence protein ComEC